MNRLIMLYLYDSIERQVHVVQAEFVEIFCIVMRLSFR